MSVELAYKAGHERAKAAFLGELYSKYIKGDVGPLLGSVFTKSPLHAGAAGALGQALDTEPGGSKILQSAGVAGGAAAANALVGPIAQAVASAVASATGAPPMVQTIIADIATGGAQSAGAKGSRHLAKKLDQFLKTKGVRVP